MTESQIVALVAAAGLGLTMLLQRKIIFSWTAIGAFWVTHLIFVATGVLLLPWFRSRIGEGVWFPGVDFSLVAERDISLSIFMVVAGMVGVLLTYHVARLLWTGSWLVKPAALLARVSGRRPRGIEPVTLLFLSGVVLVYAVAHVTAHGSIFVEGIRRGFIGGDPAAVIEARRQATNNYIFVLVAYNVMPFLSVALWLRFSSKRSVAKFYAIAYMCVTFSALVLVFQKRPLLIYVISLSLAQLWLVRNRRRDVSISPAPGPRERSMVSWRQVLVYGGIVFTLLVALYVAQTKIGRGGETITEAGKRLGAVIVVRIFGRLSIQPSMYVHYYPGVEPFYGVDNIAALAALRGRDVYRGNARVFRYFRDVDGGTIAIPALLDFYGGFGLRGWLAGILLLGVVLCGIDLSLSGLKRDHGRALLVIFMFVFVYYLSQASLPRALAGYGGGLFVVQWLALRSWKGQKECPR